MYLIVREKSLSGSAEELEEKQKVVSDFKNLFLPVGASNTA